MAEFGTVEGRMTQDESEQIARLAQEIGSGHYPTLTLGLLRRLNTQLRVRKAQEPMLVLFGRFLFGEKIARFPDDVIAWRTERDYLTLALDELIEAVERGKGKAVVSDMKGVLDDENGKAEVKRLNRVIEGYQQQLGEARRARNAAENDKTGWQRQATDARAENQALRSEIETLNKALKELGLQVNAAKNDLLDVRRENETLDSKLDFSQACALSRERQLRGRTLELTDARASVDNLRQDRSRVTEERDTAKSCAENLLRDKQELERQIEAAKKYVKQLRQDNSRLVEERNDWRRAKEEGDETIKQICSLVPSRENEDIFDAVRRLRKERIKALARHDQLNCEVIELIRQFGSWKDRDGVRHCNGEHVGHGLCEVVDAQSRRD